jgi:hypothetical protein
MESIVQTNGVEGVKKKGSPPPSHQQPVLKPWLAAQSLNLVRHTKALRPFQREEFGSGPETPSDGHVQVVNQLMSSMRRSLEARAERMSRHVTAAISQPDAERLTKVVTDKHNAHR